MKNISINKLAEIVTATPKTFGEDKYFTDVNTDSRTVKAGDCFFAVTGENFDGHNFLDDVFAKGAVCAVVSKDPSALRCEGRALLQVNDTIKALGELAAWYRKECNFKVIGITGSAGKTTTRQIVYHVLSKRFKTHQPTKNFNNFIGLPLTILATPPETQILVLELATNHPGEIEYLSKIASPDFALVTNAYPAHLAGFGSVEKIAEEKLSIAKGLLPSGTLIINSDCQPLIDNARCSKLTFKTFSCSPQSDYPVTNVILGPLAGSFTIDEVVVEIQLPGRGNIENALAAWAICSNFGISAREFAEAVKSFTAVSMRTELLQLNSITVISDCYNANPASMKNALEILANLAGSQKRRAVFICGDMAELGETEKELHRHLGRQIAESGVNLLITSGNLAAIAADAATQVRPQLEIRKFSNPIDLCNNLHKLIKDSDIILVKGSRINKLEMVVEKLKQNSLSIK
jgi:UDP-N-acetylmuramoyl-tripeptide--D-alanyl-D-alanine ligase